MPHLLEALDRCEIAEGGSLVDHTVIELQVAIEDLGGTFTVEQQLKCRRAREPAEAFRRKLHAALSARRRDVAPVDPTPVPLATKPARRRVRPGRNEPCWCGSSKKYKKCHMAADENGTVIAGDARDDAHSRPSTSASDG